MNGLYIITESETGQYSYELDRPEPMNRGYFYSAVLGAAAGICAAFGGALWVGAGVLVWHWLEVVGFDALAILWRRKQ